MDESKDGSLGCLDDLTKSIFTSFKVTQFSGEYIHHYCPNRTTADVDDNPSAFVAAPANLALRETRGTEPRGWPWVVVSLLLTLILAMTGLASWLDMS